MKKYILILCAQEGSSLVDYGGLYNIVFAQKRMSKDVQIVSESIIEKGYTPLLICPHENRYFSVSLLYKTYVNKNILISNFSDLVNKMNEIAGAMFVGISGRSGSGAFLDATHNPVAWHDYYINDKIISESDIYSTYLAYYKIPVIFASGCDICIEESRKSLFVNRDIFYVITKHTINRNLAKCIEEKEVEKLLKDTSSAALVHLEEFKAKDITLPLSIKIVFNRVDYCEDCDAFNNHTLTLINGRTIKKELTEINSIFDFIF